MKKHAGTLSVEVFSDFVCPWCPIGERRLEKAAALLGAPLEVTFRPYELNPDLPSEGVDRKKYLTEKFGSLATYESMSARVVAVAKSEGIPFHLERIERASNTRDAHRLSWLANELGKQPAVVAGLFRAYFTEGRDLGDHAVLLDVATAAGIDRERAAALLASDEGLAEVLEQERRARRLRVDGVPSFVVGDRVLLSGAQAPEVIAAALREAAIARA
jgi:predicted DsbA family dithiol-disulfide isomerase